MNRSNGVLSLAHSHHTMELFVIKISLVKQSIYYKGFADLRILTGERSFGVLKSSNELIAKDFSRFPIQCLCQLENLCSRIVS